MDKGEMEKYEIIFHKSFYYFVVIHTCTHYIHHPHGHTQFIHFYISQSFYISVLRNTFYSYFLLFFHHPFRCLSLSIFLYLLLSLRLHEHFMFSLIVSFFHVPLFVRRHIFSLIVVIFIACRCLILFRAKRFSRSM